MRGRALKSLDPRVRGDDDWKEAWRRSFAATPNYRHAREGGHPGFYRDMTLKSLDPRLRGDDDLNRCGETDLPRNPPIVMPAKAGIQGFIEA